MNIINLKAIKDAGYVMTAHLVIQEEPVAKGRPRAFYNKHVKRVATYTPKKTSSAENLIKLAFDNGCVRNNEDGQYFLWVQTYMKIPKSAPKRKLHLMRDNTIRPTKKPDWDNLGKLPCDALNGRAYSDDKCVVDAFVQKFYSDEPRTEIRIFKYQEEGA